MATMMDIFIHAAMKQMHTTHTHTHTLLEKPDLSRPHLHSFSVLLSSAWFRALVWSYNQLNRRRRTLNPAPSFCYTIYTSASCWRTRGWVKHRVEQNKSSPFASFRALTHMQVLEHTHTKGKKKNPEISSNGSLRCEKRNTAVLYYYWRQAFASVS